MINYPTSLDTLNTPSANTAIAGHAANHTDVANAIEALETKVGVDSSAVATSLDYLVKNTSSSDPGHKHTLANGATDVTISAAELNALDGITASVAEINVLDGIPPTLTSTELGYVDGVTSAIQTQLNAKEPTITTLTVAKGGTGATTLTGVLIGNGTSAVTTVTAPSGTIVGTSDSQTLTNKTQVARVASYSPAGAGTTTLNLSTGGIQTVTMPANTQTLAVSNATTGQCFILNINNVTSQGALTFFTTIRWAGGVAPTLTGTNGKRDTFGFIVTGADTYDGFVVGQNI